MKHILEMSADRGAFICQSHTNLWMKEPSYKKLTAMHMFVGRKDLRPVFIIYAQKQKAAPQQFTIEPDKKTSNVEEEEECLMCGS